MSDEHHHSPPPSAAGFFDPFGIRVLIGPASATPDRERMLRGLLEDVAASCEAEGATVIGHIKCFLASRDGGVHCNLTSRRTGARCSASASAVLVLDEPVELDLAVLVYGLSQDTIASLVHRALDRCLEPLGVVWRPV